MTEKILELKGNPIRFFLSELTENETELINYLKDNKFDRLVSINNQIIDLFTYRINLTYGIEINKNFKTNINLNNVTELIIDSIDIKKETPIEDTMYFVKVKESSKEFIEKNINIAEELEIEIDKLEESRFFFVYEKIDFAEKHYKILRNVFYLTNEFISAFLMLIDMSQEDINELSFEEFKELLRTTIESSYRYHIVDGVRMFLEELNLLKLNLYKNDSINFESIGKLYSKQGLMLRESKDIKEIFNS